MGDLRFLRRLWLDEACAVACLAAMFVRAVRWLRCLARPGSHCTPHWPLFIGAALATSGLAAAWNFRADPRSRRSAVWIGVVATLVYLATGRADMGGDATSARYAAVSLIKHGDLNLDEFGKFYGSQAIPHFIVRTPEHLVSKYAIGPAILAAPVFQAFRWAGAPIKPWHPGHPSLVWPAKVAAATIAGASVGLFFRAASRFAGPRPALVVTIAYAAGTTLLSTVSQSLWQHGPAQLCLIAAIAVWSATPSDERARMRLRALAAGALAGFVLLCRPADLFLAGVVLLWIVAGRDAARGWAIAGAMLPAAFLAGYDWYYFGAPWRMGYGALASSEWRGDPLRGLVGMLVSPARGLLVYSPVFAFVPFAVRGIRERARNGEPLWALLLAGVVLHLALYSRWTVWWGGWSLGYRMLSDVTPFACLLLIPFLETRGARGPCRAAFGLALVASVVIHTSLAWNEDCNWDRRRDTDHHPEVLWDWRHSPLMSCYRGVARR